MTMNQDHATRTTTPQLGRYEIDAGRSTVTFRTRHLFGLAPLRGRFAVRGGTVDIAEPLAASAVCAQIDAASFHTRHPQRDASVRSARLLDVARHPVVTFTSERIDGRELTGTLTVRGVTRPVTLSVEPLELSPRSFTVRATTRIDRTEFGVTAYRGLAARYLTMSLEIQCVRK
jgi:polyisoprenoid-binding protein YceI